MRIVGLLVFLVSLCGSAAASDIYSDINRLRAGGGHCANGKPPEPLMRQAALERAARELASGRPLHDSLEIAGYRSARASTISFKGEGAGRMASSLLAKPDYCAQLQDAAMAEIGVYLDARQAWIVTAAPFSAQLALAGPSDSVGLKILNLVNRARAEPRQCGSQYFKAAPALRWNDALALASKKHVDDMAHYNFFSHNGRDGSEPSQRVERAGYNWRSTGENIAGGQRRPEEAVAGWIKSPGHCANLMDPGFTEMGAAYAVEARSDLGIYWAQEFGARR